MNLDGAKLGTPSDVGVTIFGSGVELTVERLISLLINSVSEHSNSLISMQLVDFKKERPHMTMRANT